MVVVAPPRHTGLRLFTESRSARRAWCFARHRGIALWSRCSFRAPSSVRCPRWRYLRGRGLWRNCAVRCATRRVAISVPLCLRLPLRLCMECLCRTAGCLISLFYIKPQPLSLDRKTTKVVLYLFSTSNHTLILFQFSIVQLSYISFLHQTTTLVLRGNLMRKLSYISFLHQTTT